MVALYRADRYIFILWFLSILYLSFFPRLISAAAHWMSTILPHIVWPQCEFRMQVQNIGGALCSTPQSLADAHYNSAVQ